MSWLAIAKKEYIENVRNAWVITVSALFLVLTLLTSWLVGVIARLPTGLSPTESFEFVVATLGAMQAFGGFLPPILALVLGFGTLAGERESGSLALLVSQPVSRTQIVLGKWLGLWGVLATAIVVGYGIGGGTVVARAEAGRAGVQALLAFIAITLAWAAAWISITLLVSAFFQRRGTAIAGSVAIWFLFGSFVWTMLTFLLAAAATGGEVFDALEDVPPWLIVTQVLNPNQVYDGLLTTTIAGFGLGFDLAGIAREALREVYSLGVFLGAMLAWIALPLLAARALFAARDV